MVRRRRKIQRIVEQLLLKANVESPPVDVDAIAALVGAELRFESLEDISGVLFRVGDQIVIGVNDGHPSTRQRFTVAHELGHLMLHGHQSLYVDKIFPVHLRDHSSSEGIYLDEMEANAFAAELLMPEKMLEQEPELQRKMVDYEVSIQDLAKRYGVSCQAMTFRLVNLGLIRSQF